MTAPKGRDQKRCIFCDATNLSKEHFYPRWVAPLLKDQGGHATKLYSQHPIEGTQVRQDTSRPAALSTLKIRAVCGTCNSGWMNRIEGDARPFLTEMISGRPLILDRSAQLAVARWIALKTIVAEHRDPSGAVTPPADRERFRNSLEIPDYFRIYIGEHNSYDDSGYVRYTSTVSRSLTGPMPPLNGMVKNLQQVSFLIGRLFVHVNAVRLSGFEIEHRARIPAVYDNMRLWPVAADDFGWPTGPILDNESLRTISSSWDTLTGLPGYVWGGEAPPENWVTATTVV